MARLKPDLVGNAGVMFVAAELSRRGLIALPTIRNTEGVDLIVSEPNGGPGVAIQVKTSQSPRKKWLLTKSSEKLKAPGLYYVFVNLGLPGTRPEYHVVPSKTVAKRITKGHKDWLDKPRRDGRRHKDTAMREFRDEHGKYKDKWDVLNLTMVE